MTGVAGGHRPHGPPISTQPPETLGKCRSHPNRRAPKHAPCRPAGPSSPLARGRLPLTPCTKQPAPWRLSQGLSPSHPPLQLTAAHSPLCTWSATGTRRACLSTGQTRRYQRRPRPGQSPREPQGSPPAGRTRSSALCLAPHLPCSLRGPDRCQPRHCCAPAPPLPAGCLSSGSERVCLVYPAPTNPRGRRSTESLLYPKVHSTPRVLT